MKRIVGVDPGIKGAVVLVTIDGPVARILRSAAVPVREMASGYHLTDTARMARLLEELDPHVVVVERQAPRPGNAAKAMFTAGMMFGTLVEAILRAELPIRLVTPASWKRRVALLGAEKRMAVQAAREIFGASEWLEAARGERTQEHVIASAEAALMAWSSVDPWARDDDSGVRRRRTCDPTTRSGRSRT